MRPAHGYRRGCGRFLSARHHFENAVLSCHDFLRPRSISNKLTLVIFRIARLSAEGKIFLPDWFDPFLHLLLTISFNRPLLKVRRQRRRPLLRPASRRSSLKRRNRNVVFLENGLQRWRVREREIPSRRILPNLLSLVVIIVFGVWGVDDEFWVILVGPYLLVNLLTGWWQGGDERGWSCRLSCSPGGEL